MTTPTEADRAPSPEPKVFSNWLAEYAQGALDDRLTVALAEVASAVTLLEKSGSVELKLKLSEKAGGVVVEFDVKTVAPRPKTGQFFYVTDDGSLSRRDPNQPQLPTMEDTK